MSIDREEAGRREEAQAMEQDSEVYPLHYRHLVNAASQGDEAALVCLVQLETKRAYSKSLFLNCSNVQLSVCLEAETLAIWPPFGPKPLE